MQLGDRSLVSFLDHAICDLSDLYVRVRGGTNQQREGSVLAQRVLLHDHPDGCTDVGTSAQRLAEAVDLGGVSERKSCVYGEQPGDALGLGVDLLAGRRVDVQPTQRAFLIEVKLDRQLRLQPPLDSR